MIERVGQDTLRRFLELTHARNPFACRLYARLSVFGPDSPRADFWLCRDASGKDWGTLGRMGGHFTLFSLPSADFEELASFFGMMGEGMTLSASFDDCQKLKEAFPLCTLESGEIMEYQSLAVPAWPEAIEAGQNYKAIYRCLCESDLKFAKAVSFDDFYEELYEKKKKRQCFFAEARINSRVISTAGLLHLSDITAVIGCVSTVPEERGCGWASKATAAVTANALSRGLTPQLLCKKRLIPFYKRLGFTEYGRWGQLRFVFLTERNAKS